MDMQHKADAVRNHFNSSKLGVKEFCESYHLQYGYASWKQLKKFMVHNHITSTDRSRLDKEASVRIEDKIDYNLDLLDNFGIADSLSKEYESMKLPSHLKKIGILSDIHFPYHSLEALTIAIRHLKLSLIHI